jgi:DNA repair protein RecO
MHHIYTTEAFIIKSFSLGEANKGYFLFTKDLGLVKATAQSVRLQKSKLRGHLNPFSLINISLVKGREIWRITNVETVLYNPFSKDIKKIGTIKNIFSLLARLVHGEEKNENLFNVLKSFFIYLSNNEVLDENLKNLEVLTALRILFNLGYFKRGIAKSGFEESDVLSYEIIESLSLKRREYIGQINDILKETHL